jgi:hypothetical protein
LLFQLSRRKIGHQLQLSKHLKKWKIVYWHEFVLSASFR